jgi:hypothetical protein
MQRKKESCSVPLLCNTSIGDELFVISLTGKSGKF